MKTLRQKLHDKDQLTWDEWSILAAVKIFALTVALIAVAGMGMLCIKAGLLAGRVDNDLLFVAYIVAILAVAEGAPTMAVKMHNRLLSWYEAHDTPSK